ncbi:MAG TPA: hypothetical protein VGG39_04160 [Polyangiaceae bacterium]
MKPRAVLVRRALPWALVLLAFACVAAACSIQTIFPYGLSPLPGTASQLVGAGGAVVTTNDGTSVLIPPNALSTDVTITIGLAPDASPLQGATPVTAAHVFGPPGQTFAVPVCITLAFEPGLLPAGTTERNVVLYAQPVPPAEDAGDAGDAGNDEADAAPALTGYVALPTFAADASLVTGMTQQFSTIMAGYGPYLELPADAGEIGCGDGGMDGAD